MISSNLGASLVAGLLGFPLFHYLNLAGLSAGLVIVRRLQYQKGVQVRN